MFKVEDLSLYRCSKHNQRVTATKKQTNGNSELKNGKQRECKIEPFSDQIYLQCKIKVLTVHSSHIRLAHISLLLHLSRSCRTASSVFEDT